MALVTEAEVKEAIPQLGSSDYSSAVTTLIARVGELFARRCGYPEATAGATPTMESTSYVLRVDGHGGRELDLELYPVTAVSAVRDDPTGDYTDDAYLVDSADYAIEEGRRLVLTSTSTWGAWGRGRLRVRVSMTAGFVTVPPLLRQLAIQAVRHWWESRNRQGRASASSGGDAIQYAAEDLIPPHVAAGLGAFMLPRAIA